MSKEKGLPSTVVVGLVQEYSPLILQYSAAQISSILLVIIISHSGTVLKLYIFRHRCSHIFSFCLHFDFCFLFWMSLDCCKLHSAKPMMYLMKIWLMYKNGWCPDILSSHDKILEKSFDGKYTTISLWYWCWGPEHELCWLGKSATQTKMYRLW